MKYFVGLWNPWKYYSQTRHNIGFIIMDKIYNKWWTQNFSYNNKFKAEVWEAFINNQKVCLLKPQNYMNRSWNVVRWFYDYYKLNIEDILIVYDDIDLPVWKVKLKYNWSAAWHKWLWDIIQKLWTNSIPRLKIGVDRPPNKEDVVKYVLSNFTSSQMEEIDNSFAKIEELIFQYMNDT